MKLLKHFYLTIFLALLCCAGSAQINDTITATYSGTINSGYTTDSCGVGCLYNLPVILPPGFTVIDVAYTFWYQPLGICTNNQGGYVLSLDSCKTSCYSCPASFEFCPATDLSIFGEIRNCLPAPKCINDTLNFVLDFFRLTQPEIGCDSFSCIDNFNGPWSTTVYGQIDTCPTSIIEHQAYVSVFSIFPNPSTSQIILHSSFINANEVVNVTITNPVGEIIQEEKRKWTNEMSFNIKTLPPGVYYVQLQNEKGRWVERFIKE